jgi:UDP-galactopyranose mutase
VVSTPIRDVVRHYGHLEGVQIAGDAESFANACDAALALARDPDSGWLAEADLLLSAASWDTTQARMAGLIAELLGTGDAIATPALLVAAE